MITLTYGASTVALTDRLVWSDEHSWSPVQQATAWSTTGALLVDVAVKQAGRPITLDGNALSAWMSRAVANTLAAWAAIPGAQFALVLRGAGRPVIFNHADGGFEATALWDLVDGEQYAEEKLVPVLRFIQL